MKSLQTQAVITSLTSKTDGSLGLRVSTPELSAEEKVLFMSLQNLNVKLTIEPSDVMSEGLKKVEKGLEGKSPSERLYNVIYVFYKQINSVEDFQIFYKRYMENLIDSVKAKLN